MPMAVGEANRALNAWTGRASMTANTAFYVKLHTGDPGSAGTLNASSETTRKAMTAAAATNASTSNTNALTWTPLALSGAETLSHLSFWDAASAGVFLGSVALSSTASVANGTNFSIAAGSLVLNLTNTEIATGECNKILDAWTGLTTYTASAAVYAKLHTGDPGSNGTANAAAETTRKAMTFGTAASAGSIASTAAVTWAAIATGETEAWVSYWSTVGPTGGTFLGRDDITDVVITAGDDLSIASGGLVVTMG
jgi:hypothetical protein